MSTPHIWAQITLEPGERRALEADPPPGAYRAVYSYVCRAAEECRRHVGIYVTGRAFFRKHLRAAEPSWILRPTPR